MSLVNLIQNRVKDTKRGVAYQDFVDSGITGGYLQPAIETMLEMKQLWRSPNGRYFPKEPAMATCT